MRVLLVQILVVNGFIGTEFSPELYFGYEYVNSGSS